MFPLLLTIVLGMFLLGLVASLLNLRHLSQSIPDSFTGSIDPQTYAKSQDYTKAKTRDSLIEESFSLVVMLLFWLGGGFRWLYAWSESWAQPAIVTGVGVITLLLLARWLLSLPFAIHHTFGTEQRFGFNRTTPKTFISDQIKSLILGAIIGLPILAGVLWVFHALPLAWLWAWLGVSGLSLLLSFLAPAFIMPLFNKFLPMPDGELKSAIETMAKSCGFPLAGLFLMDGSKRSSKANAFFTGFGKNRRIALFDTLVEKHTTEELVGVLAHEIGHYKCHHIWRMMALGFASSGLLFFLLSFFLNYAPLHAAFGITPPPGTPLPLHFGLIFFLILYSPISQLLSIFSNALSRKHEFEADAFAGKTTGKPECLASALRKLTSDSLGNLTPHPLLVWLEYTHPPVIQRLKALENQR